MSDDVCCPNCGDKLSYEAVSQLMDSSRMKFSLAPHEGEMLNLMTVGAALTNLSKALVEAGKAVGVPTAVVLENVSVEPNGALTFHMIVTRQEPKITKRTKDTP